MDHHLDIRLRTDPEFTGHQLMSALYSKLHRALVQLQSREIGVSFPAVDEDAPSLGNQLRLHGNESALLALGARPWLQGLGELVETGAIKPAPSDAPHRCVYRVQAQSSVERLRRRAMRRHAISADEARDRIPDHAADTLRLPFAQLGSRSTGQPRFHLYIKHGPLARDQTQGQFNAYGLSRIASIPWF